jgi:GNAT superfamily N-acetyltransferase
MPTSDFPLVQRCTVIRTPYHHEIRDCCALVFDNWGTKATERCHDQLIAHFYGGKYAPVFMVAVDEANKVIGFAAYHRTMQCTFNVIWLVVDKAHEGLGIGRALVSECVAGVEANGGMLIEVITQKKEFYQRLDFFQVHHLGNDWYLMLRPTGEFGI